MPSILLSIDQAMIMERQYFREKRKRRDSIGAMGLFEPFSSE